MIYLTETIIEKRGDKRWTNSDYMLWESLDLQIILPKFMIAGLDKNLNKHKKTFLSDLIWIAIK